MPGIDLQGESEQSLVKALQQGRQEMMDLLYDAYAPVMMGVITRIVPDKEMAEEVLHETFVAIWTRIGVYDSSNNRFLIWGLAIARGLALGAVKRGKYKPQQDSCLPEDKEMKAIVQQSNLFTCMSQQEKEILDLIYLKGKSCDEVTAELGITAETLKASLKKAFVQIKAERSA